MTSKRAMPGSRTLLLALILVASRKASTNSGFTWTKTWTISIAASILQDKFLIYVAPHPIFSRLEGLDDWMAGIVEMLTRVFVLRVIAAADMTTDFADA